MKKPKQRVFICSPEGLAALFPGLGTSKLKPIRRFMNGQAPANNLKPGTRFTVAGLKMDQSAPEGFITDCVPGEETIMVIEADGCKPWVGDDSEKQFNLTIE